jgi:signal transduction histidine kinase
MIPALREMLSNAARHARASAITVTVDSTAHVDEQGRPTDGGGALRLQEGGDLASALRAAGAGRPAVLLTVADDGVGIADGGRRSGLRNLAERAGAMGGDAWYGPGPDGRGTLVSWTALL